MIHSDRVRARLEAVGITQTELARRVNVTQGAIAKIAKNNPNGSSHLHRIAHELRTTPAFLEGETDNPDENAPPPPPVPTIQHFMMPVALPSESALAAMYQAQLQVFGDLPQAELARALAKRLPNALARLQGAALYEETADPLVAEERQPPAPVHPESRLVQRR